MIAYTIHPIQSNTILTATKNEHFVSNKDISPSFMEMFNPEEVCLRL